jgi:hypothetical protein
MMADHFWEVGASGARYSRGFALENSNVATPPAMRM